MTTRRIHVSELRADTLAGKNLVKAYLHGLEMVAIHELIRQLEEVAKPTPRHVLNSEQKTVVDRDLRALRSRLKFHSGRRRGALNSVSFYERVKQTNEPGAEVCAD